MNWSTVLLLGPDESWHRDDFLSGVFFILVGVAFSFLVLLYLSFTTISTGHLPGVPYCTPPHRVNNGTSRIIGSGVTLPQFYHYLAHCAKEQSNFRDNRLDLLLGFVLFLGWVAAPVDIDQYTISFPFRTKVCQRYHSKASRGSKSRKAAIIYFAGAIQFAIALTSYTTLLYLIICHGHSATYHLHPHDHFGNRTYLDLGR